MNPIKFKTLRSLYEHCTTSGFHDNKAFYYVDGSEGYTYGELIAEIDKISDLLLQYGVRNEEKVAILSQNMPNWPISFFSVAAFGRVVVPLLPDFSPQEIENIILHSESKAIFVSKRLLPKLTEKTLEALSLVIALDDFEVIKGGECEEREEIKHSEEDDLAAIIYTSGTTGNSKGVMLSHRNFTANLYAAQVLRPGFEWDVWLSILPLSHTLENSLCMLLPMTSGASVYYMKKIATPTVLMASLAVVKPTTMLSVPLIMEKVYKSTVLPTFTKSKFMSALYKTSAGRRALNRVAGKKLMKKFGGRLRFFGIGGAKLDPEVEQFLYEAKFPYAIGYGLTETSPLLAGATPDMVKWQSTGPAVEGVTLRIANPDPVTGEGEIQAKGDNVMMGYYKNPEATAETFTEDGWFRTKDLGVFDKKGWLFIKGRLSNMIVGPSGENIYPEDIESVLSNHEMISEAIVTQEKGKLIAIVHLNEEKLKNMKEASEEPEEELKSGRLKLIENYEKMSEDFKKNYNGKMEEFKQAYDEKRRELYESYAKKRDELTEAYSKKMEEAKESYHNYMENLKKDIKNFVNTKVNKSSNISDVDLHDEAFEKTATQKIKRYLYTNKEKDDKVKKENKVESN